MGGGGRRVPTATLQAIQTVSFLTPLTGGTQVQRGHVIYLGHMAKATRVLSTESKGPAPWAEANSGQGWVGTELAPETQGQPEGWSRCWALSNSGDFWRGPRSSDGRDEPGLPVAPSRHANWGWGDAGSLCLYRPCPSLSRVPLVLPHQQWLFLFPAVFSQQPVLGGGVAGGIRGSGSQRAAG